MHTGKFLFVIGLGAALLTAALTSGARDTEEQIKAREALRQKMLELNGPAPTAPAAPQPPTPSTPPPPPVPMAAPRKKAPVFPVDPIPAPAWPMPAPRFNGFGPVPEAVENANTARMREALRQAIGGSASESAFAGFSPVPAPSENANAGRLRAALRQAMATPEGIPVIAAKPVKSSQTLARMTPVVSTPLVMATPLSPLTGSKTARLAELLRRYDVDQITPREYHTQRAAILAEP